MLPTRRLPIPLILFLLLALTAGQGRTAHPETETPPPRGTLVLQSSLLVTGSHVGLTSGFVVRGTAGEFCTGLVENEGREGVHSGFWPIFYHLVLRFVSPVPEYLETALDRVFPNPFNPSTTIAYTLGLDCQVNLEIFNLKGERVRELVRSNQVAGPHEVVWDGCDDLGHRTASGLYLCRLRAGDFQAVNKILLLK